MKHGVIPKVYHKQQSFRVIIRTCLVLAIMVGGSACGGDPNPSVQEFTPCIPDVRDGTPNIYEQGMVEAIRNLVGSTSALNIPTPISNGGQPGSSFGQFNNLEELLNTIVGSQYTASQYLIGETIRATDVISIKGSNANQVHIMVTFLSPLLIQAAYLSDYILKSQPLSEFEQRMLASTAKTAERGELLFLVTIITDNPNTSLAASSVTDIPIENLMLVNTDGLQVAPAHYDRNLDQPFESSAIFETGIMGYPIGVQKNGYCVWVLDPKFNRNIVIVGTSITAGQDTNATHTWTIPYEALVDPAVPPPPVDTSSFFDQTKINPAATVTTPPIPTNTEINSQIWQEYSMFVGAQIMQGK